MIKCDKCEHLVNACEECRKALKKLIQELRDKG